MKGLGIRLAIGTLLFSGVALADYQIDFTIPAFALGTISYAGGTAPLIGSGIQISTINAANAPQNGSVTLNCVSCVLDFTSGSLTSYSNAGGMGQYGFGPGGTFTLTGSIPGIGSNLTLLSGTFSASGQVDSFGVLDITAQFFSSNIDPGLANYFGLPNTPPQYQGALSVVFMALPGSAPNSFSSTGIMSGNVAASVPEPASMVLLGTVLLGCATMARRRLA